MMQLHFNAVAEPTQPGPKWQQLFHAYWPAYRAWLDAKGTTHLADLATSQAALKSYMPEMLPTYERLCQLADADALAARFLTGYQPPAYISGCSQAVSTTDKIQLVRNYDYHPGLMEGTLLLSAWQGRKVIVNSDCLVGAIDGMNEDGLAVSLTFGGRKIVGKGFGIPFILRYVLEFCTDVREAVEALVRIPSHMSYNVTVIDRNGAFKTVRLAPDRSPLITNAAFTTNHQGVVDWPENAAFNRTVERSDFLEQMLAEKMLGSDTVAHAFLQPPLYNTRFAESFGTLYTAVYYPAEGKVQVRWPNETMIQTFADFREEYKLIQFSQLPAVTIPGIPMAQVPAAIPADEMAPSSSTANQVPKKSLGEKIFSWEKLVDYWNNIGKSYWRKWW